VQRFWTELRLSVAGGNEATEGGGVATAVTKVASDSVCVPRKTW